MALDRRTPLAGTSRAATVDSTLGPGKRTLTEQLPPRSTTHASPELAASGGAASAAGPISSRANNRSLLPLEMLFGVRHAPAGQSARVQVAAAADRAIQRKANTATATETEPPRPSGGGTAMPGEVQAKMEGAFGADFSAVQIHTGQRAQALGAVAYTQGSDIQFAPGQYDPHSQQGQELLGHELTHVVQQAEGRVQATAQAKGMDVNTDASLEQEADQMGARAARGETVNTAGTGGNVAHATTPHRSALESECQVLLAE
jgi:hypothetical protein